MLINTSRISPSDNFLSDQIYNGLDCCVTMEVLDKLPKPGIIYDFERALQGPALDMMLRGWKIDQYTRAKMTDKLKDDLVRLTDQLNRMAHAIWDKPLNARSTQQLQDFFFNSMHIPPIWSSKKGVRKLSMDREALEKIQDYFYARPIVTTILAIRDTAKQLDVLTTEIDSDGRMRTSINVGAAETGRFSSSTSTSGTGTNMQNLEEELRQMFIADDGYKICGIDLEQTESRDVGWLCGTILDDWSYLDACESGDLHTQVARLVWPNLGWTDDLKQDKTIAEQLFYRHYSHRFMAKKLGHGSNYYGQPYTMARQAKIPIHLAANFQTRYFGGFPGIPQYHRWVAEQLQTKQMLITPFDRVRHFFGRPGDDTTLREAIAFLPQSMTADRLNLGLWRIWHYMPEVQLLLQLHDAVYFQYHEDADELAIINKALKLIEVELHHNNRTMIVPGEAKVGWNWAPWSDTNPDGLMKLKGNDKRNRTPLMERPL